MTFMAGEREKEREKEEKQKMAASSPKYKTVSKPKKPSRIWENGQEKGTEDRHDS